MPHKASNKDLIVHLYKTDLPIDPNQLASEKPAGKDPHCFIIEQK